MMKERVTILGAGESGVGAALLAHARGCQVLVSDAGTIKPGYREELESRGIAWEEGGHTDAVWQAAMIIKSPGIPPAAPVLQVAREKGIPVIGEVEFAARHTDKPIIGITGSNGKTTTTLLIHHLLTAAGLQAVLAGNVGHSLSRAVLTGRGEIWVTELSSYQLEDIVDFHAQTAVLLNITPDHLDRYGGDFNLYAAAKLNITRNMQPEDWFIYNQDDQAITTRLSAVTGRPQRLPFSLKGKTPARVEDDRLVVEAAGHRARIPLDKLPLPGPHNRMNLLAAVAVALLYGVEEDTIIEALPAFRNHPDRLEFITTIGEVDFVNDSKATNVEAVYYALSSFERPIVWVAGGQDKGNDYRQIEKLVAGKVKALVCLGRDNRKLIDHFSALVPRISETTRVEEAAEMAWNYADNRDVVLLSPACASFDLFDNYAQRGAMFREAVLKLKQRIDECQN